MNTTTNDLASDENIEPADIDAERGRKSSPHSTSEADLSTPSQLESSNNQVPANYFPSDLEVASSADDNFDADSAIGSSVPSSTVSLRSSVYQYIEENGRTYHSFKEGKYVMPNDEDEQARLDLQHHLFRMTMDDRLCLAPLSNPQNILDIATGTGIWAIEFAQEYPGSNVLGTDLSPIQPTFVPPNCRFEIDDAEDEWVFSHKFDFIHGRALLSCFKDNRFVVNSIFGALAPGGYFELQDPCMPMRSDDGTLNGTALDEWQTLIISALKSIGRNLSDSVNWGTYMKEAGFVDVVETRYFWGTNPWVKGKKQKLQAAWCCQNLLDGLNAMSMALFTRVLGWSTERIEVLLAGVRNDLKDRRIHAYAEVYVVYGKKPERL